MHRLSEKECIYLRHLMFNRMLEIRRGIGEKVSVDERAKLDKLWDIISDEITSKATEALRKVDKSAAQYADNPTV